MDISSLDLGVDVPRNCAVVLVRSFGWRRALFYDYGPLVVPPQERRYDLGALLAQQTLALVRGHFPDEVPAAGLEAGRLRAGLRVLEALLNERCEDEARYQEFFEQEPWILGAEYQAIEGHQALDDHHIPDFTAVRNKDGLRDIIEIKSPFMRCFKADNTFSAEFNNAWNQAERYVIFVRRNADYLRNERGLAFGNPRCLLVLGHDLDDAQRRAIHDKEGMNLAIEVVTYETVMRMGRAILDLVVAAGDFRAR